MGASEAVGAVTLGETERAGTVYAHNKVSVKQAVRIENLLSYKGLSHSAHDILSLVGIQLREGFVQCVAVGENLNTK
jgi:hypothetical protein